MVEQKIDGLIPLLHIVDAHMLIVCGGLSLPFKMSNLSGLSLGYPHEQKYFFIMIKENSESG